MHKSKTETFANNLTSHPQLNENGQFVMENMLWDEIFKNVSQNWEKALMLNLKMFPLSKLLILCRARDENSKHE